MRLWKVEAEGQETCQDLLSTDWAMGHTYKKAAINHGEYTDNMASARCG